VALPETALVVAAHDGVFWVAGANEMVARSDDAGRHWTVLHRHRGEMIFALQFPGGGEVLAYGSGHTRLVSRDDGATWKRDEHAPGLEAIRAVSDVSRYGYAGNHLAWTHDGGRHWVSQALESGAAKLPTPILALEARDAGHAAALAAAPPRPRLLLRRDVAPTVPQPGPEVVAATGDGGAHWELTQPPSAATWKSLWASANSYQLFGTTAGGQPRSAASSDGVHWTVSPSSLPANFYDCTAQGCLLEQGWAEIAGSKTRLWQVPPDEQEPLTASWAVVGDTFCRVSASLRCRLGRTPWQRPRTALYVAPKDTDFSHFQPPQVTFDADPRVAELHYQDPGRVAFQVLLSADGSLREALVRSTPRAEYVPAALDAVRRWKFKPALRQGKPVPTEVLISIGFFLQAP
jgi:TonB family protein